RRRGAGSWSRPSRWVARARDVHAVTPAPGTQSCAALWVGLDGDGTTDLLQAGTEQDATNINLGFLQLTLTSYYAWTEFLPQQPTEEVISNFTINPGDEIFTEVSVGNADGGLSLTGAFGRFLIMNLTTGGYMFVNTPRAPTSVSGREAGWIMERPTVGGSLPDLANSGREAM